MHRILDLYYRGVLDRGDAVEMYLTGFQSSVPAPAPSEKIFRSYFHSGLMYLKEIAPLPYRLFETEKEVDFSIGQIRMTGFIDYIGERDGSYCIVDHKSRILKPRSHRSKPTKADQELDQYLIQLYLYAAALQQIYGTFPKSLCLNCFRVPCLIEEPFSEESLENAKRWIEGTVSAIADEEDFRPDVEYFKCRYLCGMQDHCEYFRLSRG